MTPEAPAYQAAWLIRALQRRLRASVMTAVVAGALMVPASEKVPQKYKASADVLIQDAEDTHLLLADMKVPWKVKDRLPVIRSILRSSTVLERVLVAIGETIEDPARRELRIIELRRQVSVFGKGGGVVNIAFQAPTADQAHLGLKAAVDLFIEEMLRPQREGVQESTRFLGGQLDRLQAELTEVEDAILAYKTDHAEELPEVFRLNLNTHIALQQDLTAAEVKLEAAQRKREVLKERLRVFDPVTRDVEGNLVRAQAELSELTTVFTPAHPRVRALQVRIAALRDQLRVRAAGPSKPISLARLEAVSGGPTQIAVGADGSGRVGQVGDLLTGELLAYKATLAEIEGIGGEIRLLKERMKESHARVRAHASSELVLERLLRQAETKNGVYRALLERYEDALITQELALVDESHQVWLLDPPRRPSRASGPPRVVFIVGAFVGGGILAFGLGLLLEALRRAVRTPSDVEALLGQPMSGRMARDLA